MTQKTSGLRAVLAQPIVYEGFQRALGSRRVTATAMNFLRADAGHRLLDIGCGPGDLLEILPEGTEYVGFDLSETYIAAARERHGSRGSFFVGDVGEVDLGELGQFDRVLAKGVLHHLSDEEAEQLFAIAAAVLRPDGVVVTIDPCYSFRQSRLARYVVSRDRGQDVRSLDGYRALAERRFDHVETHEHHHLLRIPYSHAALACRAPKSSDTNS